MSLYLKIGLLLALGFGVLGLRFGWAGLAEALWFQGNLGYYFALGLSAVWLVLFCRVGRLRGWFGWTYWRGHLAGLVLIAIATGFLHLHEPHVMRVLYDEPSHALGALVMHWQKTAFLADTSNWVGDQFVLSGFHASFRQYLYPFLVSVLHDLTGYRVSNVFLLNFLLTPLVLLNGYLLGHRLAGRTAGMAAIGLLATLPLLAQVATSGSYDLLNIALLGGLILSTLACLEAPASECKGFMDLSLATALLLSMARSESILFLVPWALAIFTLWWRDRRIVLTFFTIISPVFLLPNLMVNMVLMAGEQGLHGNLRTGNSSFFAIDYLPQHVAEAVFYLFDFNLNSTSSVVLSVLGLLGFIGLVVKVAGAIRQRIMDPCMVWLATMVVFVTALYLLVLAQFWSSPVDVAAARFCLPLLFMGAVLGGWVLMQVRGLAERPMLICGGLLLWAVVAAAPAMTRAQATHSMPVGQADEWFLEQAARIGRARVLYLARSNYSLMGNRFASADLVYLNESPAVFLRALKAGLYREAVVFQLLEGNLATGQWEYTLGHQTSPSIVLETIDERIISPRYKARISRLAGYRKAGGELVTPISNSIDLEIRKTFKSSDEWFLYWSSLYP